MMYIHETALDDNLLPSFDDMDFLPEDDDVLAEVMGYHVEGDNFTSDDWDVM